MIWKHLNSKSKPLNNETKEKSLTPTTNPKMPKEPSYWAWEGLICSMLIFFLWILFRYHIFWMHSVWFISFLFFILNKRNTFWHFKHYSLCQASISFSLCLSAILLLKHPLYWFSINLSIGIVCWPLMYSSIVKNFPFSQKLHQNLYVSPPAQGCLLMEWLQFMKAFNHMQFIKISITFQMPTSQRINRVK